MFQAFFWGKLCPRTQFWADRIEIDGSKSYQSADDGYGRSTQIIPVLRKIRLHPQQTNHCGALGRLYSKTSYRTIPSITRK